LIVTGEISPAAEALCERLRVVRIRRTLTNGEVASLLQQSRAVLYPSVLEGFGLPPLEGFLLGTPAVWAQIPAVTEVMAGMPGGFVPDDQNEFRKAVASVLTLDDEHLERCRSELADRYAWKTIVDTVLTLYRRLVTEPT
jgi:glycosyltransferase involved in cell wall biosynthesis